MNIHEAVQQDLLLSNLTPSQIEALDVAEDAELTGEMRLGAGVHIGSRAVIGTDVRLRDAYIGERTRIGDGALIESGATIFDAASIGRLATLRAGCIVGEGITIPEGAQIGADHIIPSQQSIGTPGRLVGVHQRVVTIHGGKDGPFYSAGCQDSDDEATFEYRIMNAIDTSEESAADYRALWPEMRAIGQQVQAAYEEGVANGEVQRLRDQAVTVWSRSDKE
jgi:carbonic anhydrase/acetyltransferase-like protein (isoleucine patch superfamily)